MKSNHRRDRNGFIYFLRVGPWIKIGFTTNLKKRITAYTVHMPHRPEVLGVMLGTPVDERDVHARFAQSRFRAEWFNETRELLAFIAENAHSYAELRQDADDGRRRSA